MNAPLVARRVLLVLAAGLAAASAGGQDVSFDDVLKLKARLPDARIAYGTAPEQFGELWLPAGRGPHPVAIVIHGGCWLSQYAEGHARPMCAALAKAGVAAWCVEYRRLGDEGGGWPGTFEDVGHAADHLREIAPTHALDLGRVVAVGHSAGGHLALWLAARGRLPAADPLRGTDPLPLRGVVALAPIPDLARAAEEGVCGDSPATLLGGRPERGADSSPAALLPLGVRQTIVHGRQDRIVPLEMSERYVAQAVGKHDRAVLITVEEAGHFDLIAPFSAAWPRVQQAVRDLLK